MSLGTSFLNISTAVGNAQQSELFIVALKHIFKGVIANKADPNCVH